MDPFVQLLNQLQQTLKSCGQDTLSFPQIIFIGEPSHGKSSVVESIIGETFLPKGDSISTRRPLVINIMTRDEKISHRCFGVLAHDLKKLCRGLNEIRDEIHAETIRKAGKKKQISTEPIVLKFFTSKIPPMTLVDLPGLVKPSVADQTSDLARLTKDITLSYIKRTNSIIVLVLAADSDIMKSEGFQLAKDSDPEGERTICVVTKLDTVEPDKDLSDVLQGRLIRTKLGVFGVVNRSRQSTLEGKTMSEATKEEDEFFRRNYPRLANRQGSQQLAQFIRELLVAHVETCLPDIKDRFRRLTQQHEFALKTYGEKITDVNKTLLQILSSFSTYYASTISGMTKEPTTSELTGGARIAYIFHEIFSPSLNKINPMQGLDSTAVKTAIRNCAGVKPFLFMPENCIESLVKKQIELLEPPCITCVHLIKEEMIKIIHSGTDAVNLMGRFPKLVDAIIQVTAEFIKSRATETEKMVRNVVRIHSSYINTAHPDFVREKERLVTEVRTLNNQALADNYIVERLISAYFTTVRRAIEDAVPKSIMHCLVNHVTEKLLNELVDKLLTEMQSYGVLEESNEIVQKRRESQQALEILQNAKKIIWDLENNCQRMSASQAFTPARASTSVQ